MKNLINRIEKLQEEIVRKDKDFDKKFFINEMRKIGIEKLPYAQNSLKKFIDPETMNVHYNKHYKGYVEKLNLALEKSNFGDLELENIVKTISRFNKTIRNNAGGAYNHALFWKMLSPNPQKPKELVSQRINKDFGSFGNFKKKFEEVAKKRFGSGWVWLVLNKNNRLRVMSTPNQDNPLMNDVRNGGYPILGLDLWEHAYYLKYQNKRDDYIKNFWNVVNWDFVEKLYKMKLETKIQEETLITQLMIDNKLVLTESESYSCSDVDLKVFRDLLFPSSEKEKQSPLFRQFRSNYVDSWNKLLKTIYPDFWKEKDQLFVGHLPGLYNKENKRSLLNNITSSYSAFCIIHNDVNRYLSATGQEPIVYGEDPQKNIDELQRFFSVVEGIKTRLFDLKKSKTFKNVEKLLKKTDCMGRRNEDAAMKIINQQWENYTCEIVSGGGLEKDMSKGIDAICYSNNIEYPSQIKPFKGYSLVDNNYIVSGTSGAKKYWNVKFLIFVNANSKKVLVFNNKNTTTRGNDFIIPQENFIVEIQGDQSIEIIDCSEYL